MEAVIAAPNREAPEAELARLVAAIHTRRPTFGLAPGAAETVTGAPPTAAL